VEGCDGDAIELWRGIAGGRLLGLGLQAHNNRTRVSATPLPAERA